MTIGGIEQVAAEVGIKPELVRSAAESMRAGSAAAGTRGRSSPPPSDANKPNAFAGGPTRIVCERVVDGELQERDFSFMVDEIRRQFHEVGQVHQLGRSFSWIKPRVDMGIGRELEVVVSCRAGRTRITVQERLRNLVGQAFGAGSGIVVGLGTPAMFAFFTKALLLPEIVMAGVLPGFFLLTYAALRASYRAVSRRRSRELEAAADYFADFARELIEDAKRGRLPGSGGQKSSPLR